MEDWNFIVNGCERLWTSKLKISRNRQWVTLLWNADYVLYKKYINKCFLANFCQTVQNTCSTKHMSTLPCCFRKSNIDICSTGQVFCISKYFPSLLRIQANICCVAFCENNSQLKAVEYFCNKVPYWISEWVLNTALYLVNEIR